MLKKATGKKLAHHFSRATLAMLELTGVLGMLLVLTWLGLIWRLSQGPLQLNGYVTTRLEEAFHDGLPDFTFTVGDAALVWGHQSDPFEFVMSHVKVLRADMTPVTEVSRLSVRLSKRNLVFGRIVPRVIRVYGPELHVVRQEDGHFTLNVEDEPRAASAGPPAIAPPADEATPPQSPPAPPDASSASLQELVKGLLKELHERSGLGLLDGLHQIDISDATIFYEDKILGVSYHSKTAEVSVARGDGGIVSTALIDITAPPVPETTPPVYETTSPVPETAPPVHETTPPAQAANPSDKAATSAAPPKTVIRATVAYGWDTARTTAALTFVGIVPARLAGQSSKLQLLAEVDMPLDGSLHLDLDPNFRPTLMRFSLGAAPGQFNVGGLYPAPVPVKKIFATGAFDLRDGQGTLNSLDIDLGGPKAEASGKFSFKDGVTAGSLSATLDGMPMSGVATYWPPKLAADAQQWVTGHLSEGIATKATLEIAGAWNPAAEKRLTLDKLGGQIDFHGVRVNYFPPLPPVLEAAGTATYDAASFNIEVSGGKLEDLKVGKSTIHITGLDKNGPGEHAKIDIAGPVEGPLKTALKVLDSEPLKYLDKLGLRPAKTEGKAEASLELRFPLIHGLKLSDIRADAKAKLKDVQLDGLVGGQTLTGGPLDLVLEEGALKVQGDARFSGTPVTFSWQENFSKEAQVVQKLSAKLTLDASTLLKFGMPADMTPEGRAPVTLDYALSRDNTAALGLKGDITGLGFAVPQADFKKPAGMTGALSMSVALKDGKPVRITGLDASAGESKIRGALELGDKLEVKSASLAELSFGETHVAVQAENRGRDGYDVKVTGRQLDASSIFADGGRLHTDAEASKPVTPFRLAADVDRLLTGKDKSLEQVHVALNRTVWNRLEELKLDANAGGKRVSLNYAPQGAGHSLVFTADDAGKALSMLGITNSIRGGHLVVQGGPAKSGSRDLEGTALLEDFRINDAPVLATLLNAMSLPGLLSTLGGEGLTFKKARVNFSWTDRGEPAQEHNVRLLKLADGQTSGASLGLNFEGSIDEWMNIYDLRGTLVPVSGLNKMIDSIPIVGTLLTGGSGVIAATYTIKGPKEKPEVMVNPLSVLAPGILRKIFFEN